MYGSSGATRLMRPHHLWIVFVLIIISSVSHGQERPRRKTYLVRYKNGNNNVPVTVVLDFQKQTEYVINMNSRTQTKSVTLYDFKEKVIAYKDMDNGECFLGKLTNETLENENSNLHQLKSPLQMEPIRLTLDPSKKSLTSTQIRNLAGQKVAVFCRKMATWLLETFSPKSHKRKRRNVGDFGPFTHRTHQLNTVQHVRIRNQNRTIEHDGTEDNMLLFPKSRPDNKVLLGNGYSHHSGGLNAQRLDSSLLQVQYYRRVVPRQQIPTQIEVPLINTTSNLHYPRDPTYGHLNFPHYKRMLIPNAHTLRQHGQPHVLPHIIPLQPIPNKIFVEPLDLEHLPLSRFPLHRLHRFNHPSKSLFPTDFVMPLKISRSQNLHHVQPLYSYDLITKNRTEVAETTSVSWYVPPEKAGKFSENARIASNSKKIQKWRAQDAIINTDTITTPNHDRVRTNLNSSWTIPLYRNTPTAQNLSIDSSKKEENRREVLEVEGIVDDVGEDITVQSTSQPYLRHSAHLDSRYEIEEGIEDDNSSSPYPKYLVNVRKSEIEVPHLPQKLNMSFPAKNNNSLEHISYIKRLYSNATTKHKERSDTTIEDYQTFESGASDSPSTYIYSNQMPKRTIQEGVPQHQGRFSNVLKLFTPDEIVIDIGKTQDSSRTSETNGGTSSSSNETATTLDPLKAPHQPSHPKELPRLVKSSDSHDIVYVQSKIHLSPTKERPMLMILPPGVAVYPRHPNAPYADMIYAKHVRTVHRPRHYHHKKCQCGRGNSACCNGKGSCCTVRQHRGQLITSCCGNEKGDHQATKRHPEVLNIGVPLNDGTDGQVAKTLSVKELCELKRMCRTLFQSTRAVLVCRVGDVPVC